MQASGDPDACKLWSFFFLFNVHREITHEKIHNQGKKNKIHSNENELLSHVFSLWTNWISSLASLWNWTKSFKHCWCQLQCLYKLCFVWVKVQIVSTSVMQGHLRHLQLVSVCQLMFLVLVYQSRTCSSFICEQSVYNLPCGESLVEPYWLKHWIRKPNVGFLAWKCQQYFLWVQNDELIKSKIKFHNFGSFCCEFFHQYFPHVNLRSRKNI